MYASNNDQLKLWSEYNLTLWYRPIEALKFGLTYAYEPPTTCRSLITPPFGAARSDSGSAQRRGQGLRRFAPGAIRRLHVLLT